jgi:hypothetical protein
LSEIQAVTDAPCANLAQDLIAAYPNAKVVLNTRDVNAWLQSMETSFYAILNWKIQRYFSFLETVSPSLSFLISLYQKFVFHES